MASIWTSESVDALKFGVTEGKSASVIGQELTEKFGKEFTRNGVVGKIFRLKMGKKKKPIIVQKYKRSDSMSRSGYKSKTPVNGSNYENVVKLFEAPEIDINQTPPLMVRIGELDQADISVGGRCTMCRYPNGNARDPGGLFYCGLPTGGKSSWCSYHRPLCTTVSTSRLR